MGVSWMGRFPRLLPLPAPHPPAGAARVVVLLHGTGSEPGVFRHVARALRRRGVSVVAMAYGRRATVALDEALAELEERLLALLADASRAPGPGSRAEAPRLEFVGHSLGGLMALRLANRPALRGRVDRIVGLGAAWRGTPDPGERRFGRVRDKLTRMVLGASFVDVRTPEPFPAEIPPGVEVVSVVSDADDVVPASSARLGEVVEVSGVSHRRLTRLADVIVPILMR